MYYQNNVYGNGSSLGYGLPWLWSFSESTPNTGLITLKGKVVDFNTNKPLSPAHVYYIQNGVKVGVITNQNGEYELEASPDDVIIISHLGYDGVEALASEIRKVEYLTPKEEQLPEVVVTAPKNTPQKKDNTLMYVGLGVLAVIVGVAVGNKSKTV